MAKRPGGRPISWPTGARLRAPWRPAAGLPSVWLVGARAGRNEASERRAIDSGATRRQAPGAGRRQPAASRQPPASHLMRGPDMARPLARQKSRLPAAQQMGADTLCAQQLAPASGASQLRNTDIIYL